MDKERLMEYFDRNYLPKRDVITRLPLGVSMDKIWRELVSRRRNRATMLPIHSPQGTQYWFVTTDAMIAASEKIVEEAMKPYGYGNVAVIEESYYTSFLEGSKMTVAEAAEYIRKNEAPCDIYEQMLLNNRMGLQFVMENAYRSISEELLRSMACIVTAEMDNGGGLYRGGNTEIVPYAGDRPCVLPGPEATQGLVRELCAYIGDVDVHPLLKAAVAHAWFMAIRPFAEGNERMARLVAYMILMQARYPFFSEISLSSLIAQDGYVYYDAVTNVLREENGGDWTYLVEYYIVLLGKAIDEVHRRRETDDAELTDGTGELTEATAPEQVTAPPADVDTGTSGKDGDARDSFRGHNAGPSTAEEALMQMGFFSMGASDTGQADRMPLNEAKCLGNESDEEDKPSLDSDSGILQPVAGTLSYDDLRDRLEEIAEKPTTYLSKAGKKLLEFLDERKYTFMREEIMDGIDLDPKQSQNTITRLKEKGVIIPIQSVDARMLYGLNLEHLYFPEVIDMIRALRASIKSSRDRRIGELLWSKLDSGYVDYRDYRKACVEARWQKDMRLCQQIGLVTMKTQTKYQINQQISIGYDKLKPSQKEMARTLYETFGQDRFTNEMIVATLDYSSNKTYAALHEFVLIGIVECRKEDMLTYQFRVTPEEHPECFGWAA